MKKEKKKNNIFKVILIILIIIFLTLYISQKSGYYEYEQHKKTILTEEKIKQFENDIKNDKDVKLNDYLEDCNKKYDNKVSRLGNKISKNIEDVITIGVNKIFNIMEILFGK